jgi:hypothetical protein
VPSSYLDVRAVLELVRHLEPLSCDRNQLKFALVGCALDDSSFDAVDRNEANYHDGSCLTDTVTSVHK